MTDKWDKIALELWTLGGDLAVDIAKALRDAEKAGMERAAVICDENDYDWLNAANEAHRGYGSEPISLGDEIRRAAKETKE
jgi:hypothetical protein